MNISIVLTYLHSLMSILNNFCLQTNTVQMFTTWFEF